MSMESRYTYYLIQLIIVYTDEINSMRPSDAYMRR